MRDIELTKEHKLFIQAHRQGVHVGVILGVNLAADHCKFNARQHSGNDRQWHADALHDESDDLRDYAKTLNTPEDYGRTQEKPAKRPKANGHE